MRTLTLELGRVHEWATANALQFNPNKSKCLIIKRSLQKLEIYPIRTIYDQAIYNFFNAQKSLENLVLYLY